MPSLTPGSVLTRPTDLRTLIPVVVGVFTTGWAWLGTSWPALLAAMVFLTISFAGRLGWLRRIVLALVAYVGYSLVVGTAFSAVGLALPPALFLTGLVAGATWAVVRFGDWAFRAAPGDAVIAVTFVICAYIALRWGLGSTPGELVLQLSRGGDNANHMNLIRTIQQGQGYQYETGIYGLLGGMEFYPQGFAFLVGYTGWLVDGVSQTPTIAHLVQESWFQFALQPAVGVALVLLAVRGLLLRGGSRPVRLPMIAAAVVVAPLLIVTLYGNLATFGFQTQMFAMNAVLAAVWLATDPAFGHRALVLLGVGVTVVAVASSWFLLAPPAVFVAVLVGWPLLRRFREQPWWAWAGTAALVIAAYYPVHRSTPDTTGHLTMSGGIRLFDERLWKALAAIAVIVLVLEFNQLRKRRSELADGLTATPALWVLYGAILTALALSWGVARFQLSEAGELSYYFFKTLYLPVTMGLIPLGLGAARLLAEFRLPTVLRSWPRMIALVAVIPCLVSLYHLTGDLREQYKYLDEAPRGPIDAQAMTELMDEYPQGLPHDVDYIATGYCSYLESGQTTSWIGGLFTSWDADRQKFYLAVDRPQKENPSDVVEYIRDSPDKEITVYLQTSCDVSSQTLRELPMDTRYIDQEPRRVS